MPTPTVLRTAHPTDPAVETAVVTRRPTAAVRAALSRTWAARMGVLRRAAHGDAGDVPGWVLVTLMTAGLVLAIWAVAGPALTDLFSTAIARVTTFGG